MSAYRKPRLSAAEVARANGSSVMAALQGLDLGLAQRGPHELAGDCPRCRAVDQFSINTSTGSWLCFGCNASGVGGIALMQFARGLVK